MKHTPVSKEHPEAFVELIVFDDDGPEGFFERKYFKSSWEAAEYFVDQFCEDFHCTITQVLKE